MAVSGTGTDDSSLGYCCAHYRYRWFIVTRWWLYPLQEQISHWVVAVPVTSTGDSSLGDGCIRYRNRWFSVDDCCALCRYRWFAAVHCHQATPPFDTEYLLLSFRVWDIEIAIHRIVTLPFVLCGCEIWPFAVGEEHTPTWCSGLCGRR